MVFLRKAIVMTAVVALSGLTTALTASAGSLKDDYTAPGATERGVWFTGADFDHGSRYVFDGVIVALNGDLSRNGFAVRAYGSRADFDLNPGNGYEWQGDVMLGYIFTRNHVYGGAYVGVDYQDATLKPDDPTAKVRGTEVGFKVAADLSTDRELPHYFSLHGNYSTAFNTYWVRARAGLTRSKVAFGVEGIVLGDEDFDAKRVGGFVMFDLKILPSRPIEVTLSGGYQFVNDANSGARSGTRGGIGGGEGAYGTIVFSLAF